MENKILQRLQTHYDVNNVLRFVNPMMVVANLTKLFESATDNLFSSKSLRNVYLKIMSPNLIEFKTTSYT